MTQNSEPIWNTITLLQKFQFPWRIMSVTVFVLAGIGGLVVYVTENKNKWWTALIIVIVSILATIPMWRAKNYVEFPPEFFTGIYNGTTDTGESSPIWSVRFMEKRPQSLAFTTPEVGVIVIGPRTTTKRSYTVNVPVSVRFIENTLYFPGWQVMINGSPLRMEKLIFQDPNYRGLMTFDLDPGTYDIAFVFTETKLRTLSNYISLTSLAVFLIIIGTIHTVWQKKR